MTKRKLGLDTQNASRAQNGDDTIKYDTFQMIFLKNDTTEKELRKEHA